VGVVYEADICAREPRFFGLDGSEMLVRSKSYIFKLRLNLSGAFNIYNALCACAACTAVGVTPKECKTALGVMPPPCGRLQIIKGSPTVIIDYAHTPVAMESVIKTVKSAKKTGQKLFCVFGCGGERDKSKRPVMGKIAEENADGVILTEDNSRSEDASKITEDILRGITDRSRICVIPKRREAIETAILTAPRDSIILILGKGGEKYNIDRDGYHSFDDEAVARAAMKKLSEDEGEK
jgi:UDP-N-acetylmuramoyl-L-alanyl-D-glutamate--2,6-diaminopimelate ligase